MATLRDRLVGNLGPGVDTACIVRPARTTLTVALCAGAGAAIGSVVGGSPWLAGAGGGAGALIGYLIVWLNLRRHGLTVQMALALKRDGLELVRMALVGMKTHDTLWSVPYDAITEVEARRRILEIRVRIRTAEREIAVDTGKTGTGSGAETIEELRRRVSSARDTAAR